MLFGVGVGCLLCVVAVCCLVVVVVLCLLMGGVVVWGLRFVSLLGGGCLLRVVGCVAD